MKTEVTVFETTGVVQLICKSKYFRIKAQYKIRKSCETSAKLINYSH